MKLNAGTYNLNAGITFGGKSNVTLRGAGPDSTHLIFSGSVGCVYDTLVCITGPSSINPQPPQNTANWTAGYSKDTTTITISNKSNLSVGSILYLDQLDDSNTDNGALWVCATGGACAEEGDSAIDRPGRSQVQVVQVTSISASACPCTVGISPGLYMPNWRSTQSPGAWWMSNYISGVGVEDLSIENNGSVSGNNLNFGNARDSWAKNIRSLQAQRSHVLIYGALHVTIRDSYFHGVQGSAATSYGIETDIASSFLIENNIFQHVTSAMTMGQAAEGSVWAYNYAIDSYYCGTGCPSGWMQASSYHHTAGITYTLFEGNDGTGFTADAIHGTSDFMTAFRNRWQGYDPDGGSSGGKTAQTIPVHVYANNRYFNIIGNVLGDTRRPHSVYENFVTSATAPGAAPDQNVSIFMLGFSGNQEQATAGAYSFTVNNDVLVRNTMMRWGNWDTVNAAARFQSSEVPSGLSLYANAVPSGTTLPASFYLPGKPAWWGSGPFPAIGPDVTGGSVPGVGGHAYKIPARLCYENTTQSNGILTFNANNCYSTAAGPSAPTNLRIIP